MGLSSSQGRLLTITARLTSNEYESQQISNAKMRLSTQSQEASEEYISALNKQVFNMVSFDSNGNSVSTPLTAASLYEYNDTKNQYILTNTAGKVLISHKDAENYKKSSNLEAFLENYELKKIFKTEALEKSYNKVKELESDDPSANANHYLSMYQALTDTYRNDENRANWINVKSSAQLDYLDKLNLYNMEYDQQQQGNDITNEDLESAQTDMEIARGSFLKVVSFESWIENDIKEKAFDQDGKQTDAEISFTFNGETVTKKYADVYNNYQEYKTAATIYYDELDSEGCTPASAYQWNDKTKAQWYTNLWYKINGSSTGNMYTNNYLEMDSKMMNSNGWVSDSIAKGTVNIEAVTFTGSEMTLKYDNNPFIFTLNGIEWNTKIYSSCSDIVAADNEKAVAKAEAEYQRRTAEINAKDEKYQRKLSLLDSEHHAIQTEYDSVKSAIEKNISRSYKAFQG